MIEEPHPQTMPDPTPTDVVSLLTAIRQGLPPKYLFFWGHHPRPDGQISKSCLSQWWTAPFEISGVIYPTAEHFMMAEKARLFGDSETREKILRTPHPELAKKLGRSVPGFSTELWVPLRSEIVIQANRAKFGQNPVLKAFLLGTKERILAEASPTDLIWGIGLAEEDPRATDPERWCGLNLLGFALMQVRAELAHEIKLKSS